MRIPFTNITVRVGDSIKKPLAFGRFFQDPQRDMTGIMLSVDSLFQVYGNNGDVYACVRELREGVGRNGYRYEVEKTDEDVLLPDVDFALNAFQSWSRLKSDTIRDRMITGNAFWALVKNVSGNKIVGIQRMDPRSVSIVATEHGEVVRFIQRVGGRVVDFSADDVIHFKHDSDPSHEVFGFSPLQSIMWELKTDLSAAVSNLAFFENSAQPAALYILDPELSDTQRNSAIEQIKENFKGADKRHKSAVLSGVKEIKTLAMTNKDMEFLLGRKFTTDKICAAYGVPKFMIGYTDGVNYSNADNLTKNFAENTLSPLENDIANTITRELLPLMGHEGIAFEFNPQTLEESEKLEERGLKEVAAGMITPRQYRVKTRQPLTDEEDADPAFDRHIVFNGKSAVPLKDVGLDLLGEIPTNEE